MSMKQTSVCIYPNPDIHRYQVDYPYNDGVFQHLQPKALNDLSDSLRRVQILVTERVNELHRACLSVLTTCLDTGLQCQIRCRKIILPGVMFTTMYPFLYC